MSIYKDPRTGIYYANFVDASGKRVRKSLETRNRAVAAIKEKEELTKKDTQDSVNTPLEVFLAKYRAFIKATRSKQTCKIFETAWKKFEQYKHPRNLSDLSPAGLDDLLIQLKNKGDGAAGINRSIRALRTAGKQAEYWRMLAPQDWLSMIKLHEKKHRVEFHTQEELEKIFKAFSADTNGLVAAILACQAGLRRAETAWAKWEHMDFENNQVYVPANKTDDFRHIPMTPLLKRVLLAAKKQSASEYVVVLPHGNRESKDFISSYYKCHTEGLPFHCFYHKLRHTFASHLVQNGADLYYVSKLMGHSSIKMTEKYAHLSQHNLVSTMKLLPQPRVSKIVSTPSKKIS